MEPCRPWALVNSSPKGCRACYSLQPSTKAGRLTIRRHVRSREINGGRRILRTLGLAPSLPRLDWPASFCSPKAASRSKLRSSNAARQRRGHGATAELSCDEYVITWDEPHAVRYACITHAPSGLLQGLSYMESWMFSMSDAPTHLSNELRYPADH